MARCYLFAITSLETVGLKTEQQNLLVRSCWVFIQCYAESTWEPNQMLIQICCKEVVGQSDCLNPQFPFCLWHIAIYTHLIPYPCRKCHLYPSKTNINESLFHHCPITMQSRLELGGDGLQWSWRHLIATCNMITKGSLGTLPDGLTIQWLYNGY